MYVELLRPACCYLRKLMIPYLLFFDAFSDHACVFLCVSIHLETDLSTQEERRAHKTEVHYRGGPVPLSNSFLSLRKPNKLPRSDSAESQTIPVRIRGDLRVSCGFLDFFFFWIFFLQGNWSLHTGPPPSSSRVDFFFASSSCRVNYN